MDGYVRFSAQGAMPERLMNLAAREGIAVWGMKRRDGVLYANVASRFYVRLPRLARRAGVKIRLRKKVGLPFRLIKYRRRAGLPIGVVLFVITLYSMSFFLWNVEVTGPEKLSEQTLRTVLSEMGVKPGAYRGGLDTQLLANRLMTEIPELSWAALNIIGGNAYLEVRELEKGKEVVPEEEPCNLKAARDGIIRSIEATDGFPGVRVGEAVVEGEVLVSGIWEDEAGNSMLLHATGSVIAQTYRTERLEYPLRQQLNLAAGNPVHCRRMVLFGLPVPLSFTLPPRGAVALEREEVPVAVGKMVLPITLVREVWTPLKPHIKELTEAEADAAAEKRIRERRGELAAEAVRILDIKREKTASEQAYVYTYTLTCEEEISVQKKIIVN